LLDAGGGLRSFFHVRNFTVSLGVSLFCLLLVPLVFTGCSRSTVATHFKAPEFTLAELRTAPLVLVVAPEVRVKAFKKSYAALFNDTASLSARVSRKILDSLKLDVAPDSASSGAAYRIHVRSVTIADTTQEMQEVLLPGPTGDMQPSRGGILKFCLVTLEVEIVDSTETKRYAFRVHTKAEVPLYAYKTALLNALDAASRKVAVHLEGR
jgi:hypothetical protein